MIVTTAEMKEYLRLEPTDTEEEELIEGFILTATEYIKNATGFKFETSVPDTAKLIVKMLVAHWYDNRMVESTVMMYKVGFTVNVLLAQLAYSHTEGDAE